MVAAGFNWRIRRNWIRASIAVVVELYVELRLAPWYYRVRNAISGVKSEIRVAFVCRSKRLNVRIRIDIEGQGIYPSVPNVVRRKNGTAADSRDLCLQKQC